MNYSIIIIVSVIGATISQTFIRFYLKKRYNMILNHDEYVLLKKYIRYKKKKKSNHNSIILDNDFIQFTRQDGIIVHGILYGLHQKNVIKDTAYMIDSKTHSVSITSYGFYAIREYKKYTKKKCVSWLILTIISAFITAFATILLQMLID